MTLDFSVVEEVLQCFARVRVEMKQCEEKLQSAF